MTKSTERVARLWLAVLGAAVFGVVWAYLRIGLRFEFFRSDVAAYWQNSLDWTIPYDLNHVPGYPLAIAALRFLTLQRLNPVTVMALISFSSLVLGAQWVYACVRAYAPLQVAWLAAAWYMLWPFVGMTYAVYPLADSLAISWVVLGLYGLLRRHRGRAGLALGLALVTHKGTWPLVAFMTGAEIWESRRLHWTFLVGLLSPILCLWAAGAIHYGTPLWLLSHSVAVEAQSRSSFLILDGMVGTVVFGGFVGLIKGLLLWLCAVAVLFVLAAAWRARPQPFSLWGAALAAGLLVLYLVLNQNTIWAAFRFSKLLVIPAAWVIARRFGGRLVVHPAWLALAGAGLLGSQFAYAWYMARIFFR